MELSGISSVCSTKIAPFFSGVCATYLLWTISWQTQTGAPCTSRACSTVWMRVRRRRSSHAEWVAQQRHPRLLLGTDWDSSCWLPGLNLLAVSSRGAGEATFAEAAGATSVQEGRAIRQGI